MEESILKMDELDCWGKKACFRWIFICFLKGKCFRMPPAFSCVLCQKGYRADNKR